MAVGDLWHRTLVYFGMADEVDDYHDDYDDAYDDDDDNREREREREREQRDRDRRSTAHEDLERSYRERPNVRRLGPRRSDPDFDDIFAEEPPRGGRPTVMRSVDSRPQ